ncbi:ribosomal rRNA-processing protein 7 [Sporothrix schenckii 1099-18]|uniref:Ribosomal RNA-processing protein 7 C-terminal domain-containing protein n=2 Tax=Sporothrix schenckii TaxID=29908 RepID=U7Q6B4_SPOS1|nr:ribosomal rRNA-processing protein 7 [Sporothrix schenckii 1099-18]ERT02276.1 hypothetical protein HMPREF1624_00574 [Sporothrix schenckii ATCC 58251]KJR80484.1 ribosomal rRNA-processing protein 7 [Sporothrix schenckii 1099-18]
MASIPKSFGDYAVLPVQLPQLPSLAHLPPATHFLYVRRNAPKIATADDERSLFVANVPVDSTEEHFRALFALLVGPGRFESISFEEERRRAAKARPDNDSDDDDDNYGSESDFDDFDAVLPRQAASLADLQSRKRKREGGHGGRGGRDGNPDDSSKVAAKQLRQQATLPTTWPRSLRRSGSTAVALFADAKSVDVVLKAVAKAHKGSQYPEWPPLEGSSLGAPWLAGHNRLAYPNRESLRESVDAFFALFNQQEAAAADLARRLRNVPDEDGFVTVTRGTTGGGGRGAPARQQEAASARAKQLAKQERQRQDMTNFYRFQLRERKKEEQLDLQRKFQEDSKRVAAMREKRGKFKPEA